MNKMNTQQLLQQAFQHFQNNQKDVGERLLEQAAETNDPLAVLYFADNQFSQDPTEALSYLATKAKEGILGAGHRYALLSVFFDNQSIDRQIFDFLFMDAQKHHLESLLVLINGINAPLISNQLIADLFVLSPELAKDLGLEKPDLIEPLDLDAAFDAFLTNHQKQSALNPVVLNEEIGLSLVESALTDMECQYFKIRFSSLLKPSQVYDPVTGQAINDPIRQSFITSIQPEHVDWFSLSLDKRIAHISNTDCSQGEQLNLLYYQKGQSYKSHYDALVGEHQGIIEQLKDGGQRQKTVLCYLSDVTQGGETNFSRLPFSYAPQKGAVLMFDNIDEDGNVLKKSYHAGMPIINGDKWVLSKWIRSDRTNYGNIVYSKQT